MTIHSGKFAAIDGFDTVAMWSLNEQQAPAKGVASNTAFGPVRRAGVRSWSGTYKGYGGTPALLPGQLAAFVGYGAPTNDISGNGLRYSGNIMADTVTITWNWRTGELISHTVNWSGDLALTIADGAAVVDVAIPDMPSVVLAKVEWKPAASGILTAFPNVSQATLALSAQNQPYVNSSTVIAGKLWTGRRSGPIDWSCAIQQDDDIRVGATVPQIADDVELKLFVDAATFWLLKWGHVRDYTGLTANRETGAIISRTCNIDMTAHDGTTLGVITKPDAANYWPPA